MHRVTVVFLLILALTQFAHAQGVPRPFENITISISPSFPRAGESVLLSVRSVTTDLDRSDITWYVNSAVAATGTGQKEATVELGPLGSRTDVVVVVTAEDGESFTAERALRPAIIDLLWETDSYVPPFYKGKRLPSSAGAVRVEAIPYLQGNNGSLITSQNIIYTWRRNNVIATSVSGRGKSSAIFPAPELFGADTISVEAVSVDGSLGAQASVRIPSTDPFVVLYQDHPLFGMQYHLGLNSSATFPDTESTFAAVPYFASVISPNDVRLHYDWRVNGTSIAPDPEDPSRLTINAENSDGEARIELSLTHATDYVMEARGVWNLSLNSGFGSVGGVGADLFGNPE
jgi:hypothetical protein